MGHCLKERAAGVPVLLAQQDLNCGHIVVLLYSLAHMEVSNLKAIPTDVAKTSLPQTWHIPRGEKNQ